MPDLSFRIGDVTAMPYAAIPTILAPIKIANANPQRPVHSIVLNCQVQIEPASRPYSAAEEAKLLDLFGERDRWARTMKSMLWTNAVLKVPGFAMETTVDLLLPCTMDFDVAATKYFYGLQAGSVSVSVLFSGTAFYAGDDGALQIAQIPWDREARFKLPVEVWQSAVAMHYPESAWMRLPKETFDRLYSYKVARGIPLMERVLENLLDRAELAEVRDSQKVTAARGHGEQPMNFVPIEKIADAVLYEGYILYPYRPSSIKNQQRWNFGTLFPKQFAEAQDPHEAWRFRAEVIVQGSDATRIDARVRFLHLVPADESGQGWDEGFARFRTLEGITLAEICAGLERSFDFDLLTEGEKEKAPKAFAARGCVGRLSLSGERFAGGLYRIRAEFANETPVAQPKDVSRKQADAIAFTSAHLLLHVESDGFVFAFDPPPEFAEAVAGCNCVGVYPVLTGEEGEHNRMLCSPIILYDYPKVAPESTGDFFDGTEMDEMLALRVMTLTDAEQDEMRRSDPHARAILNRLETLPKEHLLKVHGAVREMRAVKDLPEEATQVEEIDGKVELWDPFAERPPVDVVSVFGVELRKGSRVRLWPQKKADIMDMAMEGKSAVVECIVQDLEDNIQLAVVLDDDPGRDMGLLQKAGHRFFFSPEEVEPLGVEVL